MRENESVNNTLGYRRLIYEKASGTLSNINRSIAFAGIGFIWIFVKVNDGYYSVPNELIFPAIFLGAALCCDMLQYIYKTTVWYALFRVLEKKSDKKKQATATATATATLNVKMNVKATEIGAIPTKIIGVSPKWNVATWVFFVLKIIFVLTAYILIIKYLTYILYC
jgi:hypothetical protein